MLSPSEPFASGPLAEAGPKLGLQAWTCRHLDFGQVVDFAAAHGIRYIQFVAPRHLDPKAPAGENLRKKACLEDRGLVAYAIGVINPTTDKEENRVYFEFAKLMGMELLVVEPLEPGAWDNLEELVREYDLKLAIHNHGKGTVYGDPATVQGILDRRDQRIGVCLDAAWVTAAGFDAEQVFLGYQGRVLDIHFKDKQVRGAPEQVHVPVDTEVGAGDVNYPGLFKQIARTNWRGVMAIETDSDAFALNPGPLVLGARRYFATMTTHL